MIKELTFQQVQNCKFKPEPHTVGFTDSDAEWFGYEFGGKIVSVIGVSDRHGGKYIHSLYTMPEFRKRGLQSMLISHICEKYPNDKKIAHCLESSKKIFESCGFVHYKTVYYKHGTQYFVVKGGD